MALLRRGISPVVATVLLVMIAISAGVLLYIWLQSYTQTALGSKPIPVELIRIVSVDYKKNSKLTIYVRNLGSTPVEIHKVYIYKSDGTLVQSKDVSVAIGPNNEKTFTVDNVQLAPGVYYVKVVTTNGNIAVSDYFTVSSS